MADLLTPDIAAQLPADVMARFDALPEDEKAHAAVQILEAADAGRLPSLDVESLFARMDDHEIIEAVREYAADAHADAVAHGDTQGAAEIAQVEAEFEVRVADVQDGDDVVDALPDDGGHHDGADQHAQSIHDSVENVLGEAALADDGDYIEVTGGGDFSN